MLRSKGLTKKMILLGLDGMDPRFTCYMLEQGRMPNVRKLMEMGSCREDLVLLGAMPTITPPMWATLATGAYPMTHGIIDYQLQAGDELDINYGGFYSTSCKAEQLWNVTAEAGLKTLVWHWPGGSWPPSSDSPNLMVVDGTSPGALGFMQAERDREFIAVATTETEETKFRWCAADNLSEVTGKIADAKKDITLVPALPPMKGDAEHEAAMERVRAEQLARGAFQGYTPTGSEVRDEVMEHKNIMDNNLAFPTSVSYSPVVEPADWAFEIPEGAREFTVLMKYGHMPRPCLILKNEAGIYDKVAMYSDKSNAEPIVVLDYDVFTENVYDYSTNNKKEVCKVARSMRVMELAEDGSRVKIWISQAMDCEDKSVWYPQWIFDECVSRFGPPSPTCSIAAQDHNAMMKCNHEQWVRAARWQANCLSYMLDEHNVDVVFSHYHGPDMEGHTYMGLLKSRPERPSDEEKLLKRAEATYDLADEYIGHFIPYIEKGYTLAVISDHGLVCREEGWHAIGDNYGVNAGVLMDMGYTVLKKDENGNYTGTIDWEKTTAIQQRSNSIYINLKGRNPHGIVDPADKYELEEKIITDLYGYRDPKTGHRVISMALHNKDAVLLGVGGEDAADIVFFVHESFNVDHGESLSTAHGYCNTSTSPIFLIAGPGVKENYRIKGYVREVDVAPTAAVLLGVDIPAQCEGAPAYQIFTERM